MNTITDEGRLTPRRAVLVLAVLLALGLALRVAAIVPYAMGPNTYSDDNGYLTSGITFARTGYIAYADPGLQTTAIGPGMPLLLGGLIALLGADPAGLVAAHIVFSCIGLLTAIAAYLLSELLCSRTAGLIAAGLCVLEPALLSVNIVFLTETPYMCLNLFAIYFLVASVREWRWGRYWAGVLCMCGAAFFKGLGAAGARRARRAAPAPPRKPAPVAASRVRRAGGLCAAVHPLVGQKRPAHGRICSLHRQPGRHTAHGLLHRLWLSGGNL